jgi:hypothetical protein
MKNILSLFGFVLIALLQQNNFAHAAESNRYPLIFPSVMVFTEYQIVDFSKLVQQVLDTNPKGVNVVLTSQVLLNPDLTIKQFGIVRAKEGSPFEPWSDESRSNAKKSLSEGFALIKKAGIPLTILPHVDATGELQDWRNNFIFDPSVKVDGNCYADSMIYDVFQALETAGLNGHPIEFNLAGEMGQTVYQFADSYLAILRDLRSKYPWKNLHLGIGLNHGAVLGKPPVNKDFAPSFQKLIDEIDFLGISAYHRVNVPTSPDDFDWGIRDFMQELADVGVEVPHRLPLHFCEFGLGGKPPRPHEVHNDEEELAAIARDPWSGVPNNEVNPWSKPSNADFRRKYYQAFVAFLQNQPGPYHVEEVGLWSMGSWCPHGILVPQSRDQAIVDLIDAHNRR